MLGIEYWIPLSCLAYFGKSLFFLEDSRVCYYQFGQLLMKIEGYNFILSLKSDILLNLQNLLFFPCFFILLKFNAILQMLYFQNHYHH